MSVKFSQGWRCDTPFAVGMGFLARMRYLILLAGLIGTMLFGAVAQAQDRAWLQIEAQPTLREAEDRARAYASAFPDVSGFSLRSGWYGIVLGPYSPESAAGRLVALKAENLIPFDSFIADGSEFRQQFWPVGGAAVPQVDETVTLDPVITLDPIPLPVIDPEESPQQARRAEAELPREDREALQRALQWYGFYTSTIDGAFGAGTRKSMGAWQEANGYEVTGILTTLQRAALIANYQADQSEFGFEMINEPEAGIEIILPMALVAFDHYEPPFVHFNARDEGSLRVILISQPGDQSTLYGLYDILQTLEVVPLNGERERGETSFTINGANGTVVSHSFAQLSKGMVKGYMLISAPGDADRAARVLQTLQSSFRSVGDRALDPGLVPMDDEARRGLLAGLEVRKPRFSRSGFYVDSTGSVLTTTEAVAQCGRITLDRDTDATVVKSDAATGLALIKPSTPLSPPVIAGFATTPDRLGAEIAVSGYSYEDTLPAPVLTFGALEDNKGLNGEPGINRLTLQALPGDAGGPILDATGKVIGMLLPRDTDGTRVLPEGVAFAASGATITQSLAAAGIVTAPFAGSTPLSPDDLSRRASGMTVLVSCWD